MISNRPLTGMNLWYRSIYGAALSVLVLGLMGATSKSVATTTPPQSPSHIDKRTAQAPPLKDTTIVPGKKFGPITEKTTYPELVRIFGKDKLTDVRPPDADDTEKEFGTRVNLGADYSFTLVWTDKTKSRPFEVIDIGAGWQMPLGLKVGMPMAEVQKKLGQFELVGLEGPYGGVVILKSSPVAAPYSGKMILQLESAPDASKRFPKEYKALVGEFVRKSSDPNWTPLGMRVKYVIILFERPRGKGSSGGKGVQVAP
jgi:hypothetical protein